MHGLHKYKKIQRNVKMTALVQDPVITYAGNGSVDTFSYPFRIILSTDIKVYLDGVLQSSDYNVTGVDNPSGGSVIFTTAPANGVAIRLQRLVSLDREIDYIQGGALISDTLDVDFDRIIHQVQDLDRISFKENSLGHIDAGTRRVTDVVDPVDDQDAATRGYVIEQTASSITAAAASATAAGISETNAAISAAAAELAYDNLDDRYLGAKASHPTLDNDGNPLIEGAVYWNTSTKTQWSYDGADWQVTSYGAVAANSVLINDTGNNFTGTEVETALTEVVTKDNTQIITGLKTFSAKVQFAKGADVASAATLTLGDDGNYFDITGTTTVTSIAALGTGTVVKLHFDASLTLTHSSSLVLPAGANIVTGAGDEAEFVAAGLGVWRCTNYQKASEDSGLWTPALEGQTTAGTGWVFPSATGTWAKMGNLLVVNFRIVTSTIGTGAAGNLKLTGFPSGFTAINTSNTGLVINEDVNTVLDTNKERLSISAVDTSLSYFYIHQSGSGTGLTALNVTNVTATFALYGQITIILA